jgi:hypothetical protein
MPMACARRVYQSDRDPSACCGPSFRLYRGPLSAEVNSNADQGVTIRHPSEPFDLAMSKRGH